MTLTLTAMRGYPASGKSTRARQIAEDTGAVVVNRDALRMMLHGTYHSGKREFEDQVTVAERAQVHALLKAGVSVVVDATHLEPQYLRKWAKLAAQYGASFARVDLDTDVLTCTDRDRNRGDAGGRYVGASVIAKMARRHPVSNWPNIQAPPQPVIEPVEWIDGLPVAVIVDIDGTLAHMAGRSPYDYTQVHTDTKDEQIAWLVNMLHRRGQEILITSGRDSVCRAETIEWFNAHGILWDELFMRPEGAVDNYGNKLPDYVVKLALFNENIRGKYNVRFCLDDRDQVVGLWRSLGIQCLQVAYGDF